MLKGKKTVIKMFALTLGMTTLLSFNTGVDAAVHEVKKGETLYRIANEYKMTVAELKEQNNLKSTIIFPGQKLTVKDPVTIHIVKKGDTLYSIARNNQMKVTELKAINQLTSHIIYPGQKLVVSKESMRDQLELNTQKGYMFTAEEPNTFQLFSTKYSNFFVRMEVLDQSLTLSDLKKHAEMYLKSTGKVTEVDQKHVQPFYKGAKLYFIASNSKISQSIVVKEVNGVPIRFTLHIPNMEESEDIVPALLKQLETLKVK
ncbi:LysM peptidoglycan-binding domain-containing protein [Anaerobacillus alkaliphilus]|uniref:LysM peptidoglycan-binding domain-containing protein n=1 Tax=Anaerobacillus alkaliphilus TaxID=1548597 RepID=A0A4Q0VNH4_9BACI|nr:LysM peptidoglycan-binding domain-containing protein [Anaerobacillus alkaliphilus]RXI96624.1 LysM peptidoglycan-binding domain-containing protein [Anaerobacillus alkaliphilus]